MVDCGRVHCRIDAAAAHSQHGWSVELAWDPFIRVESVPARLPNRSDCELVPEVFWKRYA
jgi:hypothetical protein